MAETASKAAQAVAKRGPRTIEGVKTPETSDGRGKLMQSYEAALRLMQAGKYKEAHTAFDEMLAVSPQDLADRIRMYINACVLRISQGTISFTSREERYDFAISLLNQGRYDEAREHLKAILAENDDADHAFYGMAVLASMTNDSHQCLEHLTEAIRRNPQHRIHARADSDFQNMADDPRFTELLYPDA